MPHGHTYLYHFCEIHKKICNFICFLQIYSCIFAQPFNATNIIKKEEMEAIDFKGVPNMRLTVWEMEVGQYFDAHFKHENMFRNYASLLKRETGRVVRVRRTEEGVRVMREA